MNEQLNMVLGMLRARPLGQSIEQDRQRLEELTALTPPDPEVRRERVTAGGVPAEWFRAPNAGDDSVVLYLHGGGYVVGSIETHRDLVSRLSRVTRGPLLSLGYRLAPEHPYPAAVEDAVSAYRWLLSSVVSPEKLVVAGDSAGGGLTLATLIAARDRGLPMPAAAVCISPWVDLEVRGASVVGNAETDYLASDWLLQMARKYLAGADPKTPLAAPLHADLAGLPPLLVQVGGAEGLLDDARQLAERAEAAGVETTLEVWEGMPHVWHSFAAFLPDAERAIERVGQYVRERTGAAS